MFKLLRDRWAARAARVNALELRLDDLERKLETLADNVATIYAELGGARDIGLQIGAHLQSRPRVWLGPG